MTADSISVYFKQSNFTYRFALYLYQFFLTPCTEFDSWPPYPMGFSCCS